VLAQNTIVQRGRATTTGDASALFVVAADDLELQDNLVAYTGADAAGVSPAINDTGRIGRLLSDTNWSAANDGQSRHPRPGHRLRRSAATGDRAGRRRRVQRDAADGLTGYAA
jgi:hypothetical protein